MDKLVSIIIPTYKTNESLKRAIDSVINQTYSNIEIIVVDDNNPDTKYRKYAEEIMKQYKKYKNIKYIQHKQNKNGSAARNTGVKNSNGFYIGFLDDDDYFFENKIEKQIEALSKSKFEISTSYYYRNNKIYSFKEKNDFTEEILLNKTTPQTSSFLMTRDLFDKVGGFDESYSRHQDYEFLLRIFKEHKIYVVNEPLYVLDNNGVNNVPSGEKLETIRGKFLKEFDDIINNASISKKKIYGVNYASVCFAYLKGKNIKDMIRVFKEQLNIYLVIYFFARCFKSLKYKLLRR